ncbi:hypothetical protein V6N13_113649 [Hibiscus sabdariffa]
MCIVSWNVRGLGSAAKRRGVRDLLRKLHCDMAILPESKWEVATQFEDILSHCVVIKGSWVVDSFSCGLMAVYAPCGTTEQFALWGELGLNLEERRDWAWCVARDFSATCWASERRGCTSLSQEND